MQMMRQKISHKVLIGLISLSAVVAWGILNPSKASAYVDNPAVPHAQEAFLEANCPASSTAPGQTIGIQWFSPTNISSTNGSGSTTIYATTAMCTNSNYNSVSDIRHFIVSVSRYQGTGNISFPGGTSFPLMNIGANDWQHASGPVTRSVSFTGLSNGYNCWTIEFDMSARYGSSTSNITGTGFTDLCVNYTLIVPAPTITSSGGCNPNGTGYVRATATGSGTWSYRLVRWDGIAGVWTDQTLIQNRPSGQQVEFDVSSWTSAATNFFHVRVRSDSTGIAYNTPSASPGYFTVGQCLPQPQPTTLYSVRIDDSQVSATGSSETTYGFGLAYGGNCYSSVVPGACNDGTLAEYPFSDNCIRIDGGACNTTNPANNVAYSLTPGNHTISISPSGVADGAWTLRGFKICAYGAGCTTQYLTQTSPQALRTGSSFVHNFLNGSNYTMRWIYTRTTAVPVCAPASQTIDVGASATLTATGGNGVYSWSSSPVVGANPASGSSYSRTYATEGTYTITLTSGGETDTCTVIVARKPYFKAYGGDVSAGSGFGGSCFNASAVINALNRGSAFGYAGAGTQLAAYAANEINEFSSAAARAGAPGPPKGLSFANNVAADEYGGNWNVGACMPNFYGTPTTEEAGPIVINSSYMDTTLSVGDPRQIITKYINGDVFIAENITYNTGATAFSPATQPFFKLVVRGNIYVGATVTRLDGVYIAQSDGTSGSGRFYTCAFQNSPTSFRPPNVVGLSSPEMVDGVAGCNRRLVVWGAVAAESIRLLRTNGTLTAAVSGEDRTSANQAETFIYTPEVWLGSQGDTFGYDAITGLPPVL